MATKDLEAISVIIPVYNHGKYLSEAINSVLQQTKPPHEIIIIDDGSTDETKEVALKFNSQIKYFFQDRKGIGAARNLGIRNATGDLLAFIDADDIWEKDKLFIQFNLLKSNLNIDMVYSFVKQFLSPDLSQDERKRLDCPPKPLAGIFAGTLLIKKASFEKVGFFREDLKVGEFIEWYSRAIDIGLKKQVIQKVLHNRRIHAQNQGIRERGNYSQYLHILKSSLDRRRQN